jgi:hypothetical protein
MEKGLKFEQLEWNKKVDTAEPFHSEDSQGEMSIMRAWMRAGENEIHKSTNREIDIRVVFVVSSRCRDLA